MVDEEEDDDDDEWLVMIITSGRRELMKHVLGFGHGGGCEPKAVLVHSVVLLGVLELAYVR